MPVAHPPTHSSGEVGSAAGTRGQPTRGWPGFPLWVDLPHWSELHPRDKGTVFGGSMAVVIGTAVLVRGVLNLLNLL